MKYSLTIIVHTDFFSICHNIFLFIYRTKFFEVDLKPVCKKCYDKFPAELRKRLKKAYETSPKKIIT